MLIKLLKKIINTRIGSSRQWMAGLGLSVATLLILLAVQIQVNYNTLLYGENNRDSIANFLVLNKVVDGNRVDNSLSAAEIARLKQQPFIEAVGELTSSRFKVSAQSPSDRFPFYTDLFFESVPNEFIDVQSNDWTWQQGSTNIPMIIPNQFLDLYNFGFAPSQNLMQLSQGMVMALPVVINIQYNSSIINYTGRVVGFSDRISSVLVPQNFLEWANKHYGSQQDSKPSRVVIRTRDAGNPALSAYLKNNGLVTDADKTRFSKYRQIVDAVVKAAGFTGLMLFLFALLVFSLFIQLTIASTKNEINLLITLGTSPGQLQKFLMQSFMPANVLICLVSIVIVAVVQFVLQSYLEKQNMYISPLISMFTVITAGIIILVLWLVNYRTIKKYIGQADN